MNNKLSLLLSSHLIFIEMVEITSYKNVVKSVLQRHVCHTNYNDINIFLKQNIPNQQQNERHTLYFQNLTHQQNKGHWAFFFSTLTDWDFRWPDLVFLALLLIFSVALHLDECTLFCSKWNFFLFSSCSALFLSKTAWYDAHAEVMFSRRVWLTGSLRMSCQLKVGERIFQMPWEPTCKSEMF